MKLLTRMVTALYWIILTALDWIILQLHLTAISALKIKRTLKFWTELCCEYWVLTTGNTRTWVSNGLTLSLSSSWAATLRLSAHHSSDHCLTLVILTSGVAALEDGAHRQPFNRDLFNASQNPNLKPSFRCSNPKNKPRFGKESGFANPSGKK